MYLKQRQEIVKNSLSESYHSVTELLRSLMKGLAAEILILLMFPVIPSP